MRRILRDNGLALVLALCFLVSWWGQSVAGHRTYNEDQLADGSKPISYRDYVTGDTFLSVTMENWESEFLQMAAYVLFTVFLFQRGSSESKDPDADEQVDRDARRSADKAGAPWPVRRGGLVLRLYEHSLFLAFLLLFLVSWSVHAVASHAEYNHEQLERGEPQVGLVGFLGHPRFWFESLQNWQSEFLAIGAMVVLSIFLRQRGSPESKPVDAPHSQTGTG